MQVTCESVRYVGNESVLRKKTTKTRDETRDLVEDW